MGQVHPAQSFGPSKWTGELASVLVSPYVVGNGFALFPPTFHELFEFHYPYVLDVGPSLLLKPNIVGLLLESTHPHTGGYAELIEKMHPKLSKARQEAVNMKIHEWKMDVATGMI